MRAFSALAEQHDKAFDKVWKEWCAISSSYEDRGLPTPLELEPQHRPRAHMLFWVFEGLARKRIPPFNLREVQYSPPPVMLDWSKLPEALRYVREPAMKYGKLWAQEHRDRFARRKTPQEHQELKALAERLRSTGDMERLWAWGSKYSLSDHPEAALVHWMLAVVNDIVPPPSPDAPASASGLDWDKLPFELKYLQGVAEEFGHLVKPAERAELVRNLRRQGKGEGSRYQELKNIAMMTDRSERRSLRRWLERFRPAEHPEAKLIASLLALLEERFSEWFLD